jgi:hypothetical protein
MKSACPNFNKVIFIKKNYLEKANNLGINNKNTNSYLLFNKKYNIISREKSSSRYRDSFSRVRTLLRTYKSHLAN